MVGQKKKFSLREEVDPEATTDIRALFYTPIRIQDGWCFGVEANVFVSVKINKKRCQVVNKTWLVSLKEAVDLVLQADSDSGSEPEVNSSTV